MSPGDFMGLCAVLIAMIVMFAIFAGVYKRRLAFLERKLEITLGATAEKAAQYATHNNDVENRVRVLERIITDGGNGRDIALQIEALRGESGLEVTKQ
ncbi:hypothetical protein [Novosphingobium sp. P6W]|uniref:hypothetical protein n=1 Tax=Novosphingobium sp. P6W TaxID=1609758 RepID=UPI0005C2CA42|nr:hypothetical protein [Novosphingobium sp. P6W]AXB75829.1 hypothetical protein TQ38_004275 [Novosphingobium sp. P6W]KIS32962.1 hypothetical protein TQ38_05610 [Novosphingobium sp. P6W]